jgi:hypothetical protein
MKFLDHIFCVHAICFVICQVEYEIRTLKTFSLLMCNVFSFYSIFSFICMLCQTLFVLVYFFFWPLCCLFFFDIRFLITPLISSNSSYLSGVSPDFSGVCFTQSLVFCVVFCGSMFVLYLI